MAGTGAPAFAAQKAKATPAPRAELLGKEAMQKLEKQGEASEQNQILAALVGDWDYDLNFWSKKGAPAQMSTGYTTNKMIFNNRFLSLETSVPLNIGGQNIPYNAIGYLGYDRIKKAFTSVWLDDNHTSMTTGTGQYDKKNNALEQKGKLMFPLLDKERPYRSEIAFTSSDTYKVTIYLTGSAGQEYKAVEIDFRRKN